MKLIRIANTQPCFRVLREDGQLPEIEGYAAIFNSTTDLGPFTESVAPGAFRASLERKDDVRALFNHDANLILGRTSSGTLSLAEDDRGLKVRITPPDTSLGRDLLTSIARGDVSQMSFGFYIEAEEMNNEKDRKKPHFTITEARLFDVSPVTFPAYEATEVSVSNRHSVLGNHDVRRGKVLDAAMARIEARKRSLTRLKLI